MSPSPSRRVCGMLRPGTARHVVAEERVADGLERGGGGALGQKLGENQYAAQARLARAQLGLGVGGQPINDMAQMYRKIWSQGPAGVEIPLNLQRSGDLVDVHVQSISRGDLLKGPQLH